MKTKSIIVPFFVVALAVAGLAVYRQKTAPLGQTANALIGDLSFVKKFGSLPTASTSEGLRLRTHLGYVEGLLRERTTFWLTDEQKANREKMLDLLHQYWMAGLFPQNYDFPGQRRPCFIDCEGRICAVGYLVEQTAGRQAAEAINAKYQYEYLLAMNDAGLDDWIEASGLTKEECAMIQPAYQPRTDQYVSPAYGISTSVVSGLNASLTVINGIQIANGTQSKSVGILGVIAGVGQVALGTLSYPNDGNSLSESVRPGQRSLSLLNIGLGTSTLVLSSWNLLKNRRPRERSLSWNVYGFPTPGSQVGLGFSLVKRL
jgi:hypothetical protein